MLRATGMVVGVLLIAVSCTGDAADAPERSPYREVTCPDDVTVGIDLDAFGVTCGRLRVPQDRDDGSSPSIDVFVARITAPGASAPDPVLVVGTNLAEEMTYDGIAPLAERVHREVLILDARGVGHSTPDASCLETRDPLERWTLVGAADDAARSVFIDAVAACHERLVGSGIDPEDFGVSAMAADAEDLRRALEIEAWNVVSFGSASQVSLELLRRYPERLRAVVMDSPAFAAVEHPEQTATSMRYALNNVTSACGGDPPCRSAFGDLGPSFDAALGALSERPVQATLSSDPSIVVDGIAFVRAVRSALSDAHGERVVEIPSMIDSASRGDVEDVAAWLAAEDAGCSGIRPSCTGFVSEGVLLASVCAGDDPLIESFQDPIATAVAADPLMAACPAWGSTAPLPESSLPTDPVPVLILLGATDAYAARPVVEALAEQLADAHVVEIPWQGHNVLGGSECARDIRNAWLDQPREAPAALCLAELSQPPFRL